MTLAERLEAHRVRAGDPLCQCGIHHSGAAWSPGIGWHDSAAAAAGAAGTAGTADGIVRSPFVQRALKNELPAADHTGRLYDR